jgi:hypothetical protein
MGTHSHHRQGAIRRPPVSTRDQSGRRRFGTGSPLDSVSCHEWRAAAGMVSKTGKYMLLSRTRWHDVRHQADAKTRSEDLTRARFRPC